MTRSHKFNDKDHSPDALPTEHQPKFFAKNGFADTDPKKTKKNGGGKGNWGGAGEEVVDQPFNFANARRRSNSSGIANGLGGLKTKFEVNEPEPVFEESMHGPDETEEAVAEEEAAEEEAAEEELTKAESSSTGGSSA